MLTKIAPYYKAVMGFLVPAAGGVLAAIQDSSPGGSTITKEEWIGCAALGIVTGGAVWAAPWRPSTVVTEEGP